MGIYFRRRFSPFSLFHVNLTGRGIGLSLGVKGFHAGISASGRKYVSASIPGTGLYMRHYAHAQPHAAIATRNPLAIPHPVGHEPQPHGIAFALGYLFAMGLMLAPFALVGATALGIG